MVFMHFQFFLPIENCLILHSLNYANVRIKLEAGYKTIYHSKKNSVLLESDNSANTSAMLFSIAEIAKASNLNTNDYFELLLSDISKHKDGKHLDFINALLSLVKNAIKKSPSIYKI